MTQLQLQYLQLYLGDRSAGLWARLARRGRFKIRRAAVVAGVACAASMVLSACSSQPPAPDWQMNAHASAQKALNAYLTGNARVEALEWARAERELRSTGRPDLLARAALLRCAAQAASLALAGPCDAFEALRVDAELPERAYADYLQGQSLDPAAAQLLPAPHQKIAQALAGSSGVAPGPLVAGVADPLSRLVAAGAIFKAGQADAAVVAAAVDAASAQGWRRPLMAWLSVQATQAEAAGDLPTAAHARRRLAVLTD
jgi:hypothetical protein